MGDQIALDKRDAEYLNLLKIDALSLTTLDIIVLALDKIGMTVEQLYNLPLDIKEVYEGFQKGDMQGIFQYSGNTTRNVCVKALRSTSIEETSPTALFDIVTDVNTLSRPASLNNGSTNRYISNEVEEIHPWITKHTSETRGQIIYQEQIMRVLREGQLDWADVTAVRKLMCKHEGKEKLAGIKQRFFNALMEFGTKKEMCDVVWSRIGDEGAYGFNVAHCVAYTLIAYYTMWLKVKHPLVFYWANMMITPEDNNILREFAQSGGHIYEVRFGQSEIGWSIDPERNGLRAGYTTIKGIGEKTAIKLMQMQEQHRLPSGEIEIDIEEFSKKIFSALQEANAFEDDAEIHDYLGFQDLILARVDCHQAVKIKDVQDGDINTVICKLSDFKIKNLRDFYKKNGKDYNEVQKGELDTYVNMRIYDEDGEMMITLSRYKYPQFAEVVEGFDKEKVYEILIDYNGSRDKGYIMNISEAGGAFTFPDEDDSGVMLLED
jgi:DNA polymerase III alpha subunit